MECKNEIQNSNKVHRYAESRDLTHVLH